MSGHKSAVITISQEEYRRLYEAERKLYYEQISQTRSELEGEIENQVQELAYHIEDRQSQFIDLIQNLNENVRNVEIQASSSFVNEQLDCLRTYLDFQADKQAAEIEDSSIRDKLLYDKLSELEESTNVRCNQLHNDILRVYKKDEQIRSMAEEYSEAGIQLRNLISNSYPKHISNSVFFSQMGDQIDIIGIDLQNQADQAALSLAQSTYVGLSSYKRNCDTLYLEWQLLKNRILSDIDILFENFNRNMTIQPVDKNGKSIGAQINTNYWTQGFFDELHQKVMEIRNYLQDLGDDITIGELKTILREYTTPLQENFIHCLMDARINALNAQIRYEIANSVLVALVEQGFKPVSGDYENGDYFGSYNATAINPSGNEINIVIDPGELNQLENTLHVISKNRELNTESELRSRANEIRKSLMDHGLDAGIFVEQEDSIEKSNPQSSIKINQMTKR